MTVFGTVVLPLTSFAPDGIAGFGRSHVHESTFEVGAQAGVIGGGVSLTPLPLRLDRLNVEPVTVDELPVQHVGGKSSASVTIEHSLLEARHVGVEFGCIIHTDHGALYVLVSSTHNR